MLPSTQEKCVVLRPEVLADRPNCHKLADGGSFIGWQGVGTGPSRATNDPRFQRLVSEIDLFCLFLSQFLETGVRRKPVRMPNHRSAHGFLVASMIVELNSWNGQCGFNRLKLADAAVVRDSERLISEGDYQFYLNARMKYEENEVRGVCVLPVAFERLPR